MCKKGTPLLRRGKPLLAPLLVLTLAFAFTAWLASSSPAEGRALNAILLDGANLVAPTDFAVAADNADTAFPADEAGFSAYYRITETNVVNDQGEKLFLNIRGITESLNDEIEPHQTNPFHDIRGKGVVQDYGLSFGIVALPMVAAVGVNLPPQKVTVYYDDHGWIVAYLAADEPEAAIWKHGPEFHQNLLLLAVNEVINVHNRAAQDNPNDWTQLAPVTPATVKYYDWQNPHCNTFILFSAKSRGGVSDPVSFVIPHTIKTADIFASAAVLIAGQQAERASTTARVLMDGQPFAEASAANPLSVSMIDLPSLRTGDATSLHRMTISVSQDEPATGVVMLVYKKPPAARD